MRKHNIKKNEIETNKKKKREKPINNQIQLQIFKYRNTQTRLNINPLHHHPLKQYNLAASNPL